jgi:hypothetical protein
VNSDLDREAASPGVALLQLGFVFPKIAAGGYAARRNKKPGAVSRPGTVTVTYWWIVVLYTRFG